MIAFYHHKTHPSFRLVSPHARRPHYQSPTPLPHCSKNPLFYHHTAPHHFLPSIHHHHHHITPLLFLHATPFPFFHAVLLLFLRAVPWSQRMYHNPEAETEIENLHGRVELPLLIQINELRRSNETYRPCTMHQHPHLLPCEQCSRHHLEVQCLDSSCLRAWRS